MTLLPRSASAPVRILSKARFSMSFPPDSSIRPRARPYVRSIAMVSRPLQTARRLYRLVLGPSGEIISDTLSETEGLLYQEVDIAQCVEPKQFHDVVGYYNRFDVFDLKVNRKRLTPIAFVEGPVEGNDDLTADFS